MRVIYAANGITEKVDKAIHAANTLGRKIEKIVLSKEDFTALYTDNYAGSPSARGNPTKNVGNFTPFKYDGVVIEVEGWEVAYDATEEEKEDSVEADFAELLSSIFGIHRQ